MQEICELFAVHSILYRFLMFLLEVCPHLLTFNVNVYTHLQTEMTPEMTLCVYKVYLTIALKLLTNL